MIHISKKYLCILFCHKVNNRIYGKALQLLSGFLMSSQLDVVQGSRIKQWVIGLINYQCISINYNIDRHNDIIPTLCIHTMLEMNNSQCVSLIKLMIVCD